MVPGDSDNKPPACRAFIASGWSTTFTSFLVLAWKTAGSMGVVVPSTNARVEFSYRLA